MRQQFFPWTVSLSKDLRCNSVQTNLVLKRNFHHRDKTIIRVSFPYNSSANNLKKNQYGIGPFFTTGTRKTWNLTLSWPHEDIYLSGHTCQVAKMLVKISSALIFVAERWLWSIGFRCLSFNHIFFWIVKLIKPVKLIKYMFWMMIFLLWWYVWCCV